MSLREKLRVFLAHARKDDAWLDSLRSHLRVHEREGRILCRDSTQIAAGERFDEAYRHELLSANLIVILVSADLLTEEGPLQLLEQAAQRATVRLLPILLRSCTRPEWLCQLKFHNTVPLSKAPDFDEALTNVVRSILGCGGSGEQHDSIDQSARLLMRRAGKLEFVKQIHDLLHELQLFVYYALEPQGHYRDEAELRGWIESPYWQLNKIHGRLSALSNEHRTCANLLATWHGKVTQARDELQRAYSLVQPLDERQHHLETAMNHLQDILQKAPTIVNHEIIGHSRQLGPAAIPGGQPDSPVLALCSQIRELAVEHNQWQSLDQKLVSLPRPVDHAWVAVMWSGKNGLKAVTEDLCCRPRTGSVEFLPSPLELQRTVDEMSRAVVRGQPKELREPFGAYRAQVQLHFYAVDSELKRLSNELRRCCQGLARGRGAPRRID